MRNPALLMSIVFVLSYLGSPTNAAGNDVSSAADNLLAALTAEQRMQAIVPFGGDARTDWHYVPKEERKGLPIKEMTAEQIYLVHILLNESLGQAGYSKTVGIMYLESILRGMEMERGRDGAYAYRDPTRYFVSVFGSPQSNGAWGFSFEGHHISLNFTVVDGELIASSPAFFGANPHRVPSGPAKELRILGSEEDRARRLMVSLSEEQARSALIGVDVPGDIFSTASPRVSPDEPQGIKASNLSPDQLELLHQLIDSYVENVADDAALERRAQVSTAGGNIYFAWIGSVEPGEAHYYRVQAPSFLIEYDNIQNSANHSHTVWRDYNGDFGRDIIGEHRLAHVH
jgi:hypothetical protein